MEADHPLVETEVSGRPSMMVRFYYSKRNHSANPTSKRLLLPTFPEGQALPNGILPTNHEPPTVEFEVGGFYEIDHGSLPPKSPAQLKLIRVVMVNEKTDLGITVIFPSLLSLREYFKMENTTYVRSHGKRKLKEAHPELDEQFVMSANHATKILRRLVPQTEANASQHLEGFWLVTPLLTRRSSEDEEEEEEVEVEEQGCHRSKVGPSLRAALQSAEVSGWGVRRRVTYIARNKGKSPLPAGMRSTHALAIVAKEEVLDKREHPGDAKPSVAAGGRKKMKSYKKKAKKPKLELTRLSNDGNRPKSSKDRWSTERYASAELKLLDIMKEKNAVLGNPILRPHLREEARKHVGDTGLLDHLLKHMAGKVVFGGKARFRRRHNAEGAMEYWLEDANLEELRHIAGVRDPSWVPPPGWSPSSSPPCCKPCGLELSQVKEELANLRRVLEELCAAKQREEKDHKDTGESGGADHTSAILQEMRGELLKWKADEKDHLSKLAASLQDIKEMREEVLQWKADEKDQLSKMADSLQDVKEQLGSLAEEIRPLRGSHSRGATMEEAAPTNRSNLKSSSSNNGNGGEKAGERRSGFRVCNPQGTFLWPDMGVQRQLGNGEDQSLVVDVPTPRSASSVTSTPLPAPPPPAAADPSSQQARATISQQQYYLNQHNHQPHHHQQPVVLVGGGGAAPDVVFHRSPHNGLFPSGTSPFAGKKKGWPVVGNGHACSPSTATISTDLALASPTYRPY